MRYAYYFAIVALVSFCFSDLAQSKDNTDSDGDPSKATSTLPNIYLDLRTIYTTVPAGSLSIGFSPGSLSSMVPALQQKLLTLMNSPALSTGSTLSSPASRSLGVDMPLTVDINDRFSVYGGFSAATTQSGTADWSTFAVTSWNVGFQADLYQQNGGSIPTLTLQSTVTRAVPDSPLATTSLNTIAEFDYALNKDETKGLLAGVQLTLTEIDSPSATVNPNIIGYVGGYYQWDNNWKFTGRVGIQSFGGAQLPILTPFPSFTQPTVRLDLDRMDDNDNRLFGVTAQIAWTPKPAYQLTVRTPLYLIRN
jgi:opacity protein-like surface antigen